MKKANNNIVLILYSTLTLTLILLFSNMQFTNSDNSSARDPGTIPKIDHIVIIVEENRSFASLVNNSDAPYINQLLKTGSTAVNYSAVSKNPYIALTSGSLTSIPNSCNPKNTECQTGVANITDEIEKSGRTWKMYAEGMPRTCYPNNSGEYVVRHNPFMFYSDIINDAKRCNNHIVPYSKLISDIKDSNIPNYSFISPNVCNDMHNCSTAIGDLWLSKNVPLILSSAAFAKQKSLLVITWDEGSKKDNKVLTIFLGNAAKKGYVSNEKFNHYSMIRTIEHIWGLESLSSNDKNVPMMMDMLNL